MSKEDDPAYYTVSGGPEGNKRGQEIEQKVAGLLENISFVANVKQAPRLSEMDRNMIDLVISFAPEENIDSVFVQVKSSSRGVSHFKETLSERIKRRYKRQLTRRDWMLENRMILIVGDSVTSKSGKTTREITDDEIVSSFMSQLQQIRDYDDENKSGFSN